MKHSWLSSVELIVLSAEERRVRIVGFTSPHVGSGVEDLSAMVAESSAQAGLRTLFVDLSGCLVRESNAYTWSPGIEGLGQAIRPNGHGVDQLHADLSAGSRARFNNVRALRTVFTEDLAGYDRIVVSLPDLALQFDGGINALAAAATCDGIYLVCVPNAISRNELVVATDRLKETGSTVVAVVLNATGQTTVGEDVARIALRCLRFAPRLGNWVAEKARASWLLN